MTAPALDGRYCTKWSVNEAGSRSVNGGITKNTATKVVIAAAADHLSGDLLQADDVDHLIHPTRADPVGPRQREQVIAC